MNRKNNDAILDPPSFDLPQEYYDNPSDFEVWSLRAPVKFDVTTLNGQMLQIQNIDDAAAGSRNEVILTSFQIDNGTNSSSANGNENHTYHLSLSQADETESFRILASKKSKGYTKLGRNNGDKDSDSENSDDSDDEIDEGRKKEMFPLPIPFTRNLNIVQSTHSNITDLDLAPSIERAAKVDAKKEKMRIPYVKIDQKTGLRKRWNVFGSNCITASAMPVTTANTVSSNHSETPTKAKRKVSDSDENDRKVQTYSSEKKKKKRAKKGSRKNSQRIHEKIEASV